MEMDKTTAAYSILWQHTGWNSGTHSMARNATTPVLVKVPGISWRVHLLLTQSSLKYVAQGRSCLAWRHDLIWQLHTILLGTFFMYVSMYTVCLHACKYVYMQGSRKVRSIQNMYDSSIYHKEWVLHIYAQFHVFSTEKTITCLNSQGIEGVILVVLWIGSTR